MDQIIFNDFVNSYRFSFYFDDDILFIIKLMNKTIFHTLIATWSIVVCIWFISIFTAGLRLNNYPMLCIFPAITYLRLLKKRPVFLCTNISWIRNLMNHRKCYLPEWPSMKQVTPCVFVMKVTSSNCLRKNMGSLLQTLFVVLKNFSIFFI